MVENMAENTAENGFDGAAVRGRIGLWERVDRFTSDPDVGAAAAEAESLGFSTVWIGGAFPGHLFENARTLLDATEQLRVASGILNIRAFTAADAIAGVEELEKAHPGRFLLGLGVSHAEFMRREGVEFLPPLAAMGAFLDELDTAGIGKDRRVLAALGPKMLELAGERSVGAHPYFTTPEHTASARAALGPDAFLAPEQKVLLETDADKARAIARDAMGMYLRLANYTASLKRLGFTDADIADGGSDRLIDAIVAWGDEETVAERVRAHLAAGADEVTLHVLPSREGATGLPRDEWRRLAGALLG